MHFNQIQFKAFIASQQTVHDDDTWESLGRTVPEAGVEIFIDGEPLFIAGAVVDVWGVLTATQGPGVLLTCGCGVPECGGYFESPKWKFNATQVKLTIPVKEYHPQLSQAFKSVTQFRFDAKQFRAAIVEFKNQLLALESAAGEPIPIQPSFMVTESRKSMTEFFELANICKWRRAKKHYAEHQRTNRYKKRKMYRRK